MIESPPESVEGYALSPQQRRAWLLEHAAGTAETFFGVQVAGILVGNLDPARLEAALRSVVGRHEILRTAYRSIAGMTLPVQVVGGPVEAAVEWRSANLASLKDPTEAALRDLRAAHRDSRSEPPLRVSITPLARDRHLLCLSLPATAADATGALRLLEEIVERYASGADGAAVVQYADVSQVFNDLLESEETEEGREFWHRFDPSAWGAGLPPFSRPEGGEGTFRPERREVPGRIDRSGRAAALAAAIEVSEPAVWLACWAALLSRLSGCRELVFGVSFSGRGYQGLEAAQGRFARLLPIEIRVEGGASLSALARQVGLAMAEASERQDYFRWEDLPGGNLHRFALVFEQEEPWPAEVEGLAVVARRCLLEPFGLRLVCAQEVDGGLRAELGFDASLFLRQDVATLAGCLSSLAESALATPDRPIDGLSILDPAARAQLSGWNATQWVHELSERCLHELFEAQADRTPERPALAFEGETLTYAELESRANRLAWHLRQSGVGPDVRVGVCLERSLSLVVALLAVLKAGGAYVPLDPSYPQERLDWMVDDSAPALLFVAAGASEPHTLGDRVRRVKVGVGTDLAELPAHRPAARNDPDQLAYLIYTSGSTGRPKAVLMPHRGIVNRLVWMQKEFPLGAADSVLQKTPFSFDASIWEIFLPLCFGARVVLARPGAERDGDALLDAVAANGITVLQLVPSHLSALSREERFSERCRGLSRLFCGGEALPADVARRVGDLGVAVCNLYGPTEAAIDATFWRMDELSAGALIPIGRPISNVRVHIVDRDLRALPVGLPGELLIAGIGLARGYWGRPALSAERFVPDPFATEPGRRVYRTGDLARLGPDGVVDFLGRIDDQLKIRGFRIEPGEIAAAMARLPGVKEVAVAARESRLVAYVVLAAEASPSPAFLSELRLALRDSLPEHMVPAEIVPLQALPRLPNGKLDRGALPAPEAFRADLSTSFAAARNPVEEVLANVLAEVLGRERIDLGASYLEMGGHSLLAMQVVSQVRTIFAVELPLRSLFELPSLAEVAAWIESEIRSGKGLGAPPLFRVDRDGGLLLSFAQQRLWFLHEMQPGSPYFNSSIALRAAGRLDRRALRASLSEIVRRHEVLRTAFAAKEGEPLAQIGPAAALALPVIDLAGLPELRRAEDSRRIASEEARRPFRLERAPLLRVSLVALGTGENLILFTLHHITGDGWSTGILGRELSVLYRAFAAGLPSPLPDPPLQYADFASWQRRWLDGEVLLRQVSWWTDQLAGSPSTLRLATDRPRPAVQGSRGGRIPFVWPPDLAIELRALARRERATMFMVVMATFQTLLHFRSGQKDLVVGTDVANRDRSEIEGLIGFFVNQLPLRARFSDGTTFRDQLAQLRETSLGAYGHQDLPFEKMVEALRPERSSEHAPMFQVKLNMQGLQTFTLDLPDLSFSRLEVHKGTSQLDIIVNVEEGEGGLSGSLEYNSDLWNAATMTGFLEDFESLLTVFSARPERPLEEACELLSEASRRRDEERAQEFADLSLQKLRHRTRRGVEIGPAAAAEQEL